MALHTVNLSCIADTYVDKGNRNTNYGSETTIKLGSYYDAYSPQAQYVGLLKFDFSSIARKKFIGAILHMYSRSALSTGGRFYYLNYDRSFDENTAVYNNVYIYYQTNADAGAIAANSWITKIQFNDASWIGLVANYGMYLWWLLSNGTDYLLIDSKEGSNPPFLEVTYEDVPPLIPTLNSPVGSFEANNGVIRFSWNYLSSVGGSQAKFDLQWSTDQSTWTTVSQTTANTYYDMPANTLPAGNIYWRVQTYNEYNEASGYSDIGAFYAIGAPEVPIILSVSNVTRPVISWSASNQQIYQVQVLQGETILHDSGLLPGIDTRSYKVPVYFADGSYTTKVRIKNEYDIYSDWGETSFTLTITRPGKPTIALSAVKYGIDVAITYTADKCLIYRSEHGQNIFIAIGTTEGVTYHDYSACSGQSYDYFVRALIGEAFTDSDPATASASLKNNLFSPVSNLSDIIELKYNLNNIPGKTSTYSPVGASALLSGRQYAVTEFSEHDESNISLAFAVKTFAEIKTIKDLIAKKETVLFRDACGEKRYGTISSFGYNRFRSGYTFSFILSNVDYDEEVET